MVASAGAGQAGQGKNCHIEELCRGLHIVSNLWCGV